MVRNNLIPSMALAVLMLSTARAICNMQGVWLFPAQGNSEFEVKLTTPFSNNGYSFFAMASLPDGKNVYRTLYGDVSSSNKITLHVNGADDWGGDFNLTGEFRANYGCAAIDWNTSVSWTKQPDIKKVHVIQSSHLDIGYNAYRGNGQGYINVVLNQYFQEHLPRAVELTKVLREMGYTGTNRKFIYTQLPWLLSLYLHCPENFVLSGILLNCPSASDVQMMRDAIVAGDVVWHAGPINMQYEGMNTALIKAGINIGLSLEKEFNMTIKYRTVSNRDVPGLTRAVLPVFAEMGVDAISIGENNGAMPVADRIFVWIDEESGTKMITMIHPKGYGGIGLNDCVEVGSVAMCPDFRTDNSGPYQSVQEVFGRFQQIQSEYPEAQVFASTFSAFVEDIMPMMDTLPVLKGEIGDVWFQGVSSDPLKYAVYREMARAREACELTNKCNRNDPPIFNFDRFLIKMPEHTWGTPGVQQNAWPNNEFEGNRTTRSDLVNGAKTWNENRKFAEYALAALGSHPLAADIKERLKFFEDRPLDITGYNASTNGDIITCPAFSVQFNSFGGATFFNVGGVNWATPDSTMFDVKYTAFDESDFDYQQKYYGGNAGYSKPGAQPYCRRGVYSPEVTRTLTKTSGSMCSVVIILSFPDVCHTKIGAPELLAFNLTSVGKNQIMAELVMMNKTATHLPEQMFMNFRPAFNMSTTDARFIMNKIGSEIGMEETMTHGSVYQHGIWEGVVMQLTNKKSGAKRMMNIASLDLPIAAPITTQKPFKGWLGTPTSFAVPLEELSPEEIIGFGYNIFNNIWNTNYPLWYPFEDSWPKVGSVDKNARYRFTINTASGFRHAGRKLR